DVTRSDDDYCVDTSWATPTSTDDHVLDAPSSRKVWDCAKGGTGAVYAYQTWDYDHLAYGSVDYGLVTGEDVERHATDTGQVLGTFHSFDITYDRWGNPEQVVRIREDGTRRITAIGYDPFGLVPATIVTYGTSAPSLIYNFSIDPVTLAVLSTTDPNGTVE